MPVSDKLKVSAQGQIMPKEVQSIEQEAFGKMAHTEIFWLGGGGAMINSRGTVLMIDPVLEGFDMPLLFKPPISVENVPEVESILITHIDNDHYSRDTTQDLKEVVKSFHAPQYVASVMVEEGLPASGHDIAETFKIGDLKVTLTEAEHNWQNESSKYNYREWKLEDYCGYWIETPDGIIWMPGDSRLLQSQLEKEQPDVILLDFADNTWHITFEGAVKLANAYPEAALVCIHWGSVDAPDWNTFNGDPARLAAAIKNPERVYALYPGQPLELDDGKVKEL